MNSIRRRMIVGALALAGLALWLGLTASAGSHKVEVVSFEVDGANPTQLRVTLQNVISQSAEVKVTSVVKLTDGSTKTSGISSVSVSAGSTVVVYVAFPGQIYQPLSTITDDINPL